MLRLLAALALVASLVAPAAAKPQKDPSTILYSGGDNFTTYKTTIADTNEPACGVMTMGTSNLGNRMIFTFKAIKGRDGLLFLISKDSWRFGKTQRAVPFKIYFDEDKDWAVSGTGVGIGDGDRSEVTLWTKGGNEASFLEAFAHADAMYVKFEEGNEALWRITMRGSRDAVGAYTECLHQIGFATSSQPFSTFNSTKSLDGEESF